MNIGNSQNNTEHPFEIGQNYLIRTVTHACVGKIVWVGEKEIVLENASWVADTGRFHKVFIDGLEVDYNSEIEPIKSQSFGIGRGAIVDFAIYSHDLPTEVK